MKAASTKVDTTTAAADQSLDDLVREAQAARQTAQLAQKAADEAIVAADMAESEVFFHRQREASKQEAEMRAERQKRGKEEEADEEAARRARWEFLQIRAFRQFDAGNGTIWEPRVLGLLPRALAEQAIARGFAEATGRGE